VGDGLEGAQRLVELDPLLRVLDGHLEGALGAAHGLGGQQDDPVVHHFVPGGPAGAGRADAFACVDPHAVEVDAVLGVGAEALLLRERDTARGGVHEQQVYARVAAREHEQPVRATREGDVALRATEPEPAAIVLRAQLHALGSIAAVGLEPRGGQDRLAGRDLRQPGLLLRFAARGEQRTGRQYGADEVGGRRERATEFLVDEGRLEDRLARPAVALGQQHAHQPQLPELLPECVGVALRIVLHLADDIRWAVLGQHAPRHVAEHLLLFAEIQVHRLPLFLSRPTSSSRGFPSWLPASRFAGPMISSLADPPDSLSPA
jgi:hypothetical protein